MWGLPLTPRAYRKMFNIPSIPLHRKIVNYIRRKPNDERGPPLASENTVRGNGAVEPLGGVILSHGFPEGTSKEGKLDAEQISENRDADWERRERERIAKDEKRQKKVAELDKIQGAVPRSKRHQWREEQLRDYPIGSPGQVDGRAVEGIDARRARWEKMKLARADAIRIHEHPWLTEEARDAAWEQHRLTFFAGDETNPEEEREEAAGRSKRAAGDKKEAAGRGTTEKARLLGKERRPEEVEGGGVRLGTLPSRDGRGRPPQVERQASLAKGGRGRRERYTDSSSSESSSEEAW